MNLLCLRTRSAWGCRGPAFDGWPPMAAASEGWRCAVGLISACLHVLRAEHRPGAQPGVQPATRGQRPLPALTSGFVSGKKILRIGIPRDPSFEANRSPPPSSVRRCANSSAWRKNSLKKSERHGSFHRRVPVTRETLEPVRRLGSVRVVFGLSGAECDAGRPARGMRAGQARRRGSASLHHR